MVEHKKRRRVSRAGRAACARAGAENLIRWHQGQVSETLKAAREKIADFEKKLRDEFPDPPAIVTALLESAVASYSNLILESSRHYRGSGRLDRITRTHALIVESIRVLFRTVRALAAYADTPEAREAVLRRLSVSVPPLSEEDRKAAADSTAARIKTECEAAKKKFAWIETGDRPDED